MDLFLGFYERYHNLDSILNPSIVVLKTNYPTVEEHMTSLQSHMALLQKVENKGFETYIRCLETILTITTNHITYRCKQTNTS